MRPGVRKYRPQDYPTLARWYIEWGMSPPTPESLSDFGFIVDDRVAGFAYFTNSNIALIEGVISNPHTVPSHRRQALKRLMGMLIDTSVALGYTQIIGVTDHNRMIDLAHNFGFKTLDKSVLLLRERGIEEELAEDEE